MSAATHGQTPYYFVPGPSRHPVLAAVGLFFVILGAGQWVNGHQWGAYSVLFGAEFRPRDFELYVGAGSTSSAFNSLAKDNNFTHATEQGDTVVVQGELTMGFGVPVIPTNTGDLGTNEAIMVDTGLYGYESTRWDREVTNYREESKDADVFKIRHRKDFVVMKSEGAIFINGGTS